MGRHWSNYFSFKITTPATALILTSNLVVHITSPPLYVTQGPSSLRTFLGRRGRAVPFVFDILTRAQQLAKKWVIPLKAQLFNMYLFGSYWYIVVDSSPKSVF